METAWVHDDVRGAPYETMVFGERTPDPVLSIVLPTLNRVQFLAHALASIPNAAGDVPYEVIVVAGESEDDTRAFLEYAATRDEHVRVHWQHGERTGCIKSFNLGFRAARGEYIAWFNDDAEFVGTPFPPALALLQTNPNAGQIAFPFYTRRISSYTERAVVLGNQAHLQTPLQRPEFHHVKWDGATRIFADFGVMRRDLFEQLGFWGDYFQYAGDSEISVKVWQRGLQVVPLDAACGGVLHWQLQDETRLPNVDKETFDARWQFKKQPATRRGR